MTPQSDAKGNLINLSIRGSKRKPITKWFVQGRVFIEDEQIYVGSWGEKIALSDLLEGLNGEDIRLTIEHDPNRTPSRMVKPL